MARLMDSQFKLPGTKFRFGFDALVGLLPGVGDAATAAAGLWLIVEASKLNVPKSTLVKMLINFVLDLTVGSIPIAGDVFDAAWKSNAKNAKLVQKHLAERYPEAATGSTLPER
jgi:hypothetical protein